jgi:hypothetical protein
MVKATHHRRSVALLLVASVHCSLLADVDSLTRNTGAVDRGLDAMAYDGALESGRAEGDSSAAQDGTLSGDGGVANRFCASLQPTPAFCEDYDRGPLGPEWVPRIVGVGTIGTDTEEAQSRPASRRFTIGARAPGAACSYVVESFAAPARYTRLLRVQSDIFIGRANSMSGVPDISSVVNSMTLSDPDGTGDCSMYVGSFNGEATLYIQPENATVTPKTYSLSTPIPQRRWTRTAIEISGADGPMPSVTVSVDGVMALNAAPIPPGLGCKQGRILAIYTGFLCYSGTVPSELRVDNVALWAQ